MAIVFLAAVTETCGEDKSATPLGPTQRPTPLQLSEGDSLVWESDLGEDLGLASDDTTKLVQIGFDFEFYETLQTEVYVDTNGNLHFDDPESHHGHSFPFHDQPLMIAAFYADLDAFDDGAVYYNLLGEPPNRRLVVTWLEIPYWPGFNIDPGEWNTFQVQLFESTNQIQFGYNGLFGGANVGIARDEVEYIAAEWSRDSLDMNNICYYPVDDTYEESMGPCAPCPNRPWFRDASFRDELRELWESSNPVIPGEDPSLTTERGAWIFEQGGSYILTSEGTQPINTKGICATSWQTPPPPGNLVAMVHTHPWATGGHKGICGYAAYDPEITVDTVSDSMSTEDMSEADRLMSYGVGFGYVIYENGGVLEYEPPSRMQPSRYPACLR